ncbi:MAG: hypothetical protein ACR2NZ_25050 [Rubripirellula sp.]
MSDASTTTWSKTLVAHRIVQTGLLITLLWKWHFFWIASRLYGAISIADPFFPDWLESAWVLRLAFGLAVLSIALNLVAPLPKTRKLLSWITLLCLTVTCVHQGSYNDMTFVTAWWTSLWSVWFVHRMADEDQQLVMNRAAFLSRLILSVVLLGGAVGKWTPEYWSGEVFYDIYFVDRDYWVFNFLRDRFDAETLREIAKWYSRQVIVVETVAGLGLWALPARMAAIVGVILLTSIIVLSNYYLVSVLACLIGLAAVGLLVPRKPRPAKSETTQNPAKA